MTLERNAYPRPSLRRRFAVWLRIWAEAIDPAEVTQTAGKGTRLGFLNIGSNLGHPVWQIRSIKGGFTLGRIEWSNQWRLPKFVPDPDGVYDKQAVAEIYAKMRSFQ